MIDYVNIMIDARCIAVIKFYPHLFIEYSRLSEIKVMRNTEV